MNNFEFSAPLTGTFVDRHIGVTKSSDLDHMLNTLGFASLDALSEAALPETIQIHEPLEVPEALGEEAMLDELKKLAAKNVVNRSFLGQGYYGTFTPPVIKRNILENPSWYTAYTPYQPEISQGRLEALLNFQTMVAELTGMNIANASMLDEATAAAEAMTLLRRVNKTAAKDAAFLVDQDAFAQTKDVIATRAKALGTKVQEHDFDQPLPEGDFFGALLQYPGDSGKLRDVRPILEQLSKRNILGALAADLLALTIVESPGSLGATVAVGTTQRFGVPMGFGGPHAGYMAVAAGLERNLPGRLVGVSKDAAGNLAYRLALQTREQHIRREKATSNICTAQVLLAVMAGMYAVYHGPDGLRAIAERVNSQATRLAHSIAAGPHELVHEHFFDTVRIRLAPGTSAEQIAEKAHRDGYLIRALDAQSVQIALDETTTEAELEYLSGLVGSGQLASADSASEPTSRNAAQHLQASIPAQLQRTSDYLTNPVFNTYRSETQMMRYLKRLADYDYALDRGMIPLGSCTMKLNAAAEMAAVTWPEFSTLHPFAPAEDTEGIREMAEQLQNYLARITGYDAVSIQPNAGSQGEFAGLLAIRAYHEANGDHDRTICLIPTSAHGTNAASAVMAGLKVVPVATDSFGNIDLDNLKSRLHDYADQLAAIMLTYPSTHGVFEGEITQVCDLVHQAGGQVYVDGANLNALVGLAQPGGFGGDVSHLNLHKTFCIPHGGGGPGVGPIGVGEHLIPFLPPTTLQEANVQAEQENRQGGLISAAPYGSASILPISWAYIRMMGPAGLKRATQSAILAANYVAARLAEHYPILYTGANHLVAHECILDLRGITATSGVSVDDVAKRLIDYGFHAPTMSFPVAGTLMVEPTESEDLAELDRFIDAMIAIRHEITAVENGTWSAEDNPLVNAPHTAHSLTEEWTHPYSREVAVYPFGVNPLAKYWPPVRRVEQAYGDRHLICSCPSVEELAMEEPVLAAGA